MSRYFSSTSTDRVVVTDHADLDATTGITVEAWVMWESAETDNVKHIVSKWNSYILRISQKAGSVGFLFAIFDTASVYEAGGGSPAANVWYHMTGKYDGTTVSLRVYDSSDGSVTNYTQSHSGSIDSGANDLYIGNYEGLDTAFDFRGYIENVRIWKDLALSDGEIDHLRWSKYSNHRSPVLNMPLEGIASPEIDYSGNGHTGTVTGATIGAGSLVWTQFASSSILAGGAAAASGRIMSSLAGYGGLAGHGGLAGRGGGLAG